jgi:protein phosphatase 1 regulatory subunit 7
MQQLEDLWLNGNKIESWDCVEKLKELSSLRTIYLERNPLYNNDRTGYRRKVMLALPNIQQIDAVVARLQ